MKNCHGSVLISWRNDPKDVLSSVIHFDTCFLKYCPDENDLPHFEQLIGFLKVGLFPVICGSSVLYLILLFMIDASFNADRISSSLHTSSSMAKM